MMPYPGPGPAVINTQPTEQQQPGFVGPQVGQKYFAYYTNIFIKTY